VILFCGATQIGAASQRAHFDVMVFPTWSTSGFGIQLKIVFEIGFQNLDFILQDIKKGNLLSRESHFDCAAEILEGIIV
jgi:hypothetical protein